MNRLIDLRHTLHQNPELSGNEVNTAKAILSFLEQCNPDQLIPDVGGHGIIAIWKGTKKGQNILLRADLDALPIQETNDLPYKSLKKAVSHKCGHDGHMAILCGVAINLANEKPERGDIILLFQPAEETGQGAKAVMADKKFQAIEYDYAFALHNLPKKKKGTIICKNGSFCPASTGLKINLLGKTAHASQPHTGNNPAMATAQIMFCFDRILETTEFMDKTLITLTHTNIGEESFGVSAGHSEIWLTLRAFDNHDFDLLKFLIERETKAIASKHNLGIKSSYHESFEVTENDSEAVNIIKSVAKKQNLTYKVMRKPNPWSEDFGLFLKDNKGAMFGLGSGKKTPNLHNPDYDFPDEIIESGVQMFWGIIQELNN
nr:amidohydrolase [Roseivirga sp. E12]